MGRGFPRGELLSCYEIVHSSNQVFYGNGHAFYSISPLSCLWKGARSAATVSILARCLAEPRGTHISVNSPHLEGDLL